MGLCRPAARLDQTQAIVSQNHLSDILPACPHIVNPASRQTSTRRETTTQRISGKRGDVARGFSSGGTNPKRCELKLPEPANGRSGPVPNGPGSGRSGPAGPVPNVNISKSVKIQKDQKIFKNVKKSKKAKIAETMPIV